ncbi:Nuclear poly(A) polymerase 1, partial [Ananas comosus]
MNSSYNVSSSTLRVMTEEFQRGFDICEKTKMTSGNGKAGSKHTYGMLQCHLHPGDFSDRSKSFHCCFFMGLRKKQDAPTREGEQFDIRATVEEFKLVISMYSLWKPRMEIQAPHIKRQNVPSFVFPNGIRPLRPPPKADKETSGMKKPASESPPVGDEGPSGTINTKEAVELKKRKPLGDPTDASPEYK